MNTRILPIVFNSIELRILELQREIKAIETKGKSLCLPEFKQKHVLENQARYELLNQELDLLNGLDSFYIENDNNCY